MKLKIIAGWLMSLLAVLAFAPAAYLKLSSNPMEVATFVQFGLPVWFMYVVGAVEAAGIVLLLVPKRPLIGAVLLTIVGVSAAVETGTHGQIQFSAIPLIAAALAIGGAQLRSG